MNTRIWWPALCALAACHHGQTVPSRAPEPTTAPEVQTTVVCQSPEQLVAAARRMELGREESLTRKFTNPTARQMYSRVTAHARRIQQPGLASPPEAACIPGKFPVTVSYHGDAADLSAVGFQFVGVLSDAQETHSIADGFIDPMRLGELAAIAHVEQIIGPYAIQSAQRHGSGQPGVGGTSSEA